MMSQIDLTKDESDCIEEIVLAFFCFSGCFDFFCPGIGLFSIRVEFIMDFFVEHDTFPSATSALVS